MINLNSLGESILSQFRGLNGRHPGQWPVVPRIACAIAVTTAVIALGWFFYWSDQIDRLDAGEREEQKLKDDYRAKLFQAVNLNALRKQKEEVSVYVSKLEKQLPSKAEMDALLSDINQAGLGRGLQFELFKPGQVLVKDYYAELPIDIRISGSYHDLGAFASDIANLPRIVTLNNLSLGNKDGTLTLEAIAKTFRYLDPDEVATQRKTAADKKAAAAKAGKK